MTSRQGRPLRVLVYVLGAAAALLVLATFVLLAVNGHPEGLLCVVAGAAIPVALTGTWRLAQGARARTPRSWADPFPNADPPVVAEPAATAAAELRVERTTVSGISPPSPASRTREIRLA